MADELLENLIAAVKKIPIAILHLPESEWRSLSEARRGLSSFTLTRPHAHFEKLKNNCIVLMFPELDGGSSYLGVVRSNQAIATLDSRIGIVPTVKLIPERAEDLAARLDTSRARQSFLGKVVDTQTVNRLTEATSTGIIDALWELEENRQGLR
jgi:hypothetical protein